MLIEKKILVEFFWFTAKFLKNVCKKSVFHSSCLALKLTLEEPSRSGQLRVGRRGILFCHFSKRGDEEIFNFRAQTVANPIKHIKGYIRDNNLSAKVAVDDDYAWSGEICH